MDELRRNEISDDDKSSAGQEKKQTRRGRPEIDPEQKVIPMGVCGLRKHKRYIETWNPGNPSLAFQEMMDKVMKMWPGGAGTSPRPTQESRNAPGTRTSLKRRIRELEAEREELLKKLRHAGIEDEPH